MPEGGTYSAALYFNSSSLCWHGEVRCRLGPVIAVISKSEDEPVPCFRWNVCLDPLLNQVNTWTWPDWICFHLYVHKRKLHPATKQFSVCFIHEMLLWFLLFWVIMWVRAENMSRPMQSHFHDGSFMLTQTALSLLINWNALQRSGLRLRACASIFTTTLYFN